MTSPNRMRRHTRSRSPYRSAPTRAETTDRPVLACRPAGLHRTPARYAAPRPRPSPPSHCDRDALHRGPHSTDIAPDVVLPLFLFIVSDRSLRPGRPGHIGAAGTALSARDTGPSANVCAGRRNGRGPAETTMKPKIYRNNHLEADSGPGTRAETAVLRRPGERTSITRGGPRPRTELHHGNEGRKPAVPITARSLIACDRHREVPP